MAEKEKPATPATEAPQSLWGQRIAAFAAAVKKPAEEIATALRELVGEPGDDAVSILADRASLPDDDLRVALSKGGPKIPLGVLNKNLLLLRGQDVAVATPSSSMAQPYQTILPQVPDDESFIASLQVGGTLKVEPKYVMSAIKAAIADALRLYDIPQQLAQMMEEFADTREEPVSKEFWELQKVLLSRSYGELFQALGVDGRQAASEARKRKLLERMNADFWSTIQSFQKVLQGWQENWSVGMNNPAMLLAALATGQGRTMLPASMMQPPDTSPVRSAAEEVVNKVNSVFSGTGLPAVIALAYDAAKINSILQNPQLPSLTGQPNRDLLLKSLGIAVGSEFPRLERSLIQYVMGIFGLKDIPPGDQEISYLSALLICGNSIAWDKIPASGAGVSKPSSHSAVVGISRRRGSDNEDRSKY